jgi:hypothetical protein
MLAPNPPPTAPSFVSLPEAVARRRLHEALARLSPLQRQVILLRLQDNVEPGEIARRLDVAPAAIGASLAFATSQLRVQLSDRPQDRESGEWLKRCCALLRESPAADEAAPEPDRRVAAAARAAVAAEPKALPAGQHRRAPVTLGLWPRLPAALALLVLGAALALGWQAWRAASRPVVTSPPGPHRMPPPTAPEAPLTAPDFMLVLMRQQHPGLLDELEFHVWLSEQEALQ